MTSVLPVRAALFAAALGVQAAPDARVEVRFGDARLAHGERLSISASHDASLTTKVDGGGAAQELATTTHVELVAAVEVTGAEGAGEPTATLELTRARFEGETPLGPQSHDVPAAGKSWTARRERGVWKFEGGGAAPPDEESEQTLREVAERALSPSPLARALAGRSLAKGAKVEIEKADASRLLAGFTDAATVESLQLELRDARREEGADVALFAADVRLSAATASPQGRDTTIHLTGELTVDVARSLLLRAKLTGPIRVDATLGGPADPVTVHGTGSTTIAFSASVGPARPQRKGE